MTPASTGWIGREQEIGDTICAAVRAMYARLPADADPDRPHIAMWWKGQDEISGSGMYEVMPRHNSDWLLSHVEKWCRENRQTHPDAPLIIDVFQPYCGGHDSAQWWHAVMTIVGVPCAAYYGPIGVAVEIVSLPDGQSLGKHGSVFDFISLPQVIELWSRRVARVGSRMTQL